MSTALLEQLYVEASRNPKKVALLGVLTAVALYFWAPLLWRSFSSSDKNRLKGASASVLSTPTSFPTQQAGEQTTGGRSQQQVMHWESLRQVMERQPWMEPAEYLVGRPNPFDFADLPSANDAESDQQKSDLVQQLVAALAAKLSGTMVGNRVKVAVIGGKNYALTADSQGPQITLDVNGQTLKCRLVDVQPGGITVEFGGSYYDVKIPRRKATGSIILSASP